MAKNSINNYKRRFYDHKIHGIYATGTALILAIFLVTFFTLSAGDWELLDGGYALLIGLMAAVLLGSIVYANYVRLKRITDDVVGKRIPDLNEDFWASCISKSTLALVLWEVFIFVFLCTLLELFATAPGGVVFVIFLLMIGTLVVKLLFNRKVKDIRQRYRSSGLGEKEYPVSWGREIFMGVFSAIVLEALMVVCLVEGVDKRPFNLSFGATIYFFCILTVILIVTLIFRLRTKINLREKDRVRLWKETHKQADYLTMATKNAQTGYKPVAAQTAPATKVEGYKPVSAQTAQTEGGVGQTESFVTGEDGYERCESFSALSKSFGKYAEQCGLRIDEGDCRKMISAMATSRAIWLRSENKEFTARVAKTLSKYFTGKGWELHLRSGATTETEMVHSPVQNGEGMATTLVECLSKAKRATNSFNVLTVHNAEVQNFGAVFESFISAFRAPEGENCLTIDYSGKYASNTDGQNAKTELPANLWCIFVGDAGKRIDKTKCEYATEVKLRYPGEMHENIMETKKLSFLSFARYNELLNETLAAHFLPLEVWKKFDRIEEYLQEQIPFEITNPLARQMEHYSSVQLSCGEEQDAVIDALIESRLLPLLENYTKEDVNQEGSTFVELLDGLFGMDNLPLTQKALSDKNFG